MLEATGLVAGYGDRIALDEIALSLAPGTLTAVIGPNGSGKTTLIRCLSRVLRPTKGTILLMGEDAYALSPEESAKRVAVVPQFEEHVFDFTVLDVVRMGRFAWGGLGAGAVAEAMALAACEDLALRPMSELSGGERQRVLLARALAQQTPVILLDEPTAHMDVGFQIATLSVLRMLAKEGRTVLAAVHDLNLVAGFFDRAILLHDGRVAIEGTVEEVLQSEEIERVYGAVFERIREPRTGRLVLAPEFVPERAKAKSSKRIHLIGGGGSAAALVTELWQLGHTVSLGITSEADSDCEAARRLRIPVATAAPFTPFDESHRRAALELASDADHVVLCPAPYGPGNLENLVLAESLRLAGKQLWVLQRGVDKWDFTIGASATAHERKLLGMGASSATVNALAGEIEEKPK